MSILSARGVGKTHGGHPIFDGLDLLIQADARIGLVGPNGAGKTTLLRLLAGVDRPDTGELTRRRGLRIAWLPQEVAGDERNALDTVLAQRADIAELEHELATLEAELATPGVAENERRLADLLEQQERLVERWEQAGGPRVRNEAAGYLRALGIDDTDWSLPTGVLSGGQRKLVALAGCLLCRPELLLLDEPDTHLDPARKAQLEQTIREFDGAVVLVSHDRYLLDETVSSIGELENGRLRIWEGNYSAYAVAREVALLRQQEVYVAQQKEIARLEAAVARFKLWASIVVDQRHIKQARNKQRQIDRMEKVERPVMERRRMALELSGHRRGGQKALELRDAGVAFGDELVLLGVQHTFWRGERVGIVGANGAGKTVLGRLLAGDLEPSWGEVWRGPSIDIGYYAQDSDTLDLDRTLVETVRGARPMYEEQAVAFLGRFLFGYRMAWQRVGELSGGERSRLRLALLMLGGANCLVLDEPTNHLDISSAEVLEAALAEFDGTVLVISHDRYFLERVTDRVVEVAGGGLRAFDGGYAAYLEAQMEAQKAAEGQQCAPRSGAVACSTIELSYRKLQPPLPDRAGGAAAG